MIQIIESLDNAILLFINDILSNPVLDKVMVFITSLGNLGLIWIAISLILIAIKKYRNIGFICLGALIINLILGEGILKNLIERPRPNGELNGITMLIPRPITYSFPSGHTSSAFAAALVLSTYLKKYSWGFWLLAGAIAFSRLYLYVHYPSDILGGIILGLISGFISIKISEKIKQRKRPINN
ncbi:phosphatase PAP2 family protein [Clostridium sp.]|uniref:phosphatase PAP2 family protein n=1 Tax=Clostridium sp. TaxID=1506 RepID=UPI003463BE0D